MELHNAAEKDHQSFLQVLQTVSDIDEQDEQGNSALHLAAFHGQAENALALLAKGASVNLTNNRLWTPLSCACRSGHIDLASTLISNGATIDAATDDGWTPLELVEDDAGREFLRQRYEEMFVHSVKSAQKPSSSTTGTSLSLNSYDNLIQAVQTRVRQPEEVVMPAASTRVDSTRIDETQGASTIVDSIVEDIDGRSSGAGYARTSGRSQYSGHSTHHSSQYSGQPSETTRRSTMGGTQAGTAWTEHHDDDDSAAQDVWTQDETNISPDDDAFEKSVQARIQDAMAPVLQSPLGMQRTREAFFEEAEQRDSQPPTERDAFVTQQVAMEAMRREEGSRSRERSGSPHFSDITLGSDAPSMDDEQGDPDLVRLAGEFDKWSVLLKRSLLNDFLDCKKTLLSRHKAALVKEYKRHKGEAAQQQEEIRRMQEFVRDFESTVARKDEEIALLKEQISVMTMEARDQRHQGEQEVEAVDYDHEVKMQRWSARYRKDRVMRKVLLRWHRHTKNTRWKAIDTISQERVEEATSILADECNEKMQRMQDQLDAALADARDARVERDRFEDQMKKSFMRGVCALNLEAMGMFKSAGVAMPSEMNNMMEQADLDASEQQHEVSRGDAIHAPAGGVSWGDAIHAPAGGVSWGDDVRESMPAVPRSQDRRALREKSINVRVQQRPEARGTGRKKTVRGRSIVKTTVNQARDPWTTQSTASRPSNVVVQRHNANGGSRRVELGKPQRSRSTVHAVD